MGIFDKYFRKDNSNKKDLGLIKTKELLDENLYWQIIKSASKKYPDQDTQEQSLISQLTNLSPIQIVSFKLRTNKLLYDIYNSKMWCAGYIMNGGCSDDGFEYFRCWVISKGKDVYYSSMSNPDNLVHELDDEIEDYEFEGFLYVANDAFKKKTGKEIYDFMDDETSEYRESNVSIEFDWEEDQPETLKALCPKLFEAKWN